MRAPVTFFYSYTEGGNFSASLLESYEVQWLFRVKAPISRIQTSFHRYFNGIKCRGISIFPFEILALWCTVTRDDIWTLRWSENFTNILRVTFWNFTNIVTRLLTIALVAIILVKVDKYSFHSNFCNKHIVVFTYVSSYDIIIFIIYLIYHDDKWNFKALFRNVQCIRIKYFCESLCAIEKFYVATNFIAKRWEIIIKFIVLLWISTDRDVASNLLQCPLRACIIVLRM